MATGAHVGRQRGAEAIGFLANIRATKLVQVVLRCPVCHLGCNHLVVTVVRWKIISVRRPSRQIHDVVDVPEAWIATGRLRKGVAPENVLRCSEHEYPAPVLGYIRNVLHVHAPTGFSPKPVPGGPQFALDVVEPPVVVAVHDVIDVFEHNHLWSIGGIEFPQQSGDLEEDLASAVVKASPVAGLGEALAWEPRR